MRNTIPAAQAARRAIPPCRTPYDLSKAADSILKRAHCDTVTGARMDKQYGRKKLAERNRLGRHRRAKTKKLGKFGAASPVRNVLPEAEIEEPEAQPSGS